MSDSRIVQLINEIDPARILIIKPSALGDVVQSLPLLPVLRERYPEAKIDWVIRSELADLLAGHPQLHQLRIYHRKGTLADAARLLGQLRGARYDLVFDLQGLLRTGVMTLATRAAVRVGL